MMLSRRTLLAGAGALTLTKDARAAAPWPTQSAADAGFVSDLAARIDHGVKSGLLKNTHAVLIARHGRIVVEQYYKGADENWGRPLGEVAHGPDTLHDLRSVSKSVVSLLYGIALSRNLVPAPDAPLLTQFPEHTDLAKDPARAAWTIRHALNMALGTEWNEQLPYTDPNNSEISMEMAPDRNRFILDRPIIAPAGQRWTYNGGCTALIGHLIEQGTGHKLPAFAQETLFAPLGIPAFEWNTGSDKVASAASGLRLTARDLARIGDLVINKGAVSGSQIVPASWIETVLKPSLLTGDGLEYSHFWFHGDILPMFKAQPRWMAGFGNGGQRLWISPTTGITVVHFSGAYNQPDSWITPMRIWRELVLANLIKP